MLESAMEELLALPHVRVTKVEHMTEGSYRITLERTLPGTTCRKCGRRITTSYGHDDGVTLHTKARVLTRRCYGLFNLRHFFQRLTLDIEGSAAVTRCMATR